eukprot:XP_017949471.1 PREDICTED: protein kinase C delta type-like [Xenopus tropicalis]
MSNPFSKKNNTNVFLFLFPLFVGGGTQHDNCNIQIKDDDESQRLGLNGNIREHAFYSTINWEDQENRRLTPPFQTGMPSADNLDEYQRAFSPQCSNEETNLKNFSYVDPSWNWQE